MENMINGITHYNMGKPLDTFEINRLQQMKEIFVCFDFTCNLNCPHCTLKDITPQRYLDKVYNTMRFIRMVNDETLTFNLFGGEPLLLKDEELKIFEEFFDNTKIILSTNLLSKLTPYKIKLMKKVEDVNTSWNPKRFTNEQYQHWLKQLKILNDNDISYSVMITLTKDLIQMNPLDFYNLVCSWEKCRNIDLKQMIGDLTNDFEAVDEWLCRLYDIWKFKKPLNLIFNEIKQIIEGKRIWKNYCKTTTTIMPNGYLKDGCPYYEYEPQKPFCYQCEYYPICKGGCNIQEKCTFPKKLYEKIKNEQIIHHS